MANHAFAVLCSFHEPIAISGLEDRRWVKKLRMPHSDPSEGLASRHTIGWVVGGLRSDSSRSGTVAIFNLRLISGLSVVCISGVCGLLRKAGSGDMSRGAILHG